MAQLPGCAMAFSSCYATWLDLAYIYRNSWPREPYASNPNHGCSPFLEAKWQINTGLYLSGQAV